MLPGFPVENVIYQDADILVVNKPSGLLTIPDGYIPTIPNLASLLQAQFIQVLTVHRLDKDTSGLVLFALNPVAHQELNRQFRERLVHKAYLALASPVPAWQTQEINLPLQVNAGRSHLTKVDLNFGKPANTTFTLLDKKANICQLECSPKTGYRHQIRAHLYSQGIAILGDVLYRPTTQVLPPVKPSRLMLQAQTLQFTHPATKKTISFELPIDPELERYWDSLPTTV